MSKTNGSGWRYQCWTCNRQVGIDKPFPKKCPGCGAPGWWGHLAPKIFKNNGKKDGTTIKTPTIEVSGGVKTRAGILSQEDKAVVYAVAQDKGICEPTPGNGRGRPLQPVPEDLIKDLDHQGFSSRAMVDELDQRGFKVGYKTIQRVLTGKR